MGGIIGIIERGGTASLRSHTCVKRNAVSGARFKGLSLYFLYQKRNLIHIKMGLDAYLIRIQNPYPPCHGSPLMIIPRNGGDYLALSLLPRELSGSKLGLIGPQRNRTPWTDVQYTLELELRWPVSISRDVGPPLKKLRSERARSDLRITFLVVLCIGRHALEIAV